MITYYAIGDIYEVKEELKKIIPTSTTFNNRWKYDTNFKWWELKVPQNFNSKKYEEQLRLFCKDKNIRLEKLDITNNLKKSIDDFKDIHTFFQYFYKHNYKKNR